ncbi:Heparinase II/III N-terminus [Tenacibaculum sp. MAR_2009_124]|uniref:alginate lyase family protein n=1 Tax=Tenacibaculum sp. MAR_2009_124 TaxID=1250059 RepID=UPI000895D8BA|nr:alginate lyase family protein [Tenacibaculum sp. MAR_2009_124]SEB69758.1 Heparinase II/III N-terminus [Tenacibaculum sp. MAR_2009_124]
MDRSKIITLYHTIKYLKSVQVYYRLYYLLRNRFIKKSYSNKGIDRTKDLIWSDEIFNNKSYLGAKDFEFLNILKRFENKINWNYSQFGKLWTYNLNYFDFLNQKEISVDDGLELIKNYIRQDSDLIDGKEPYVISLRGINWVKFLSKNTIKDKIIDETLYYHYQILLDNLEYHLLGNHLLENGFSLLFGGYYFNDERLLNTARKILKSELEEQILKDGAHYELSPMYHQILLGRLLDCIQLVRCNDKIDNKKLLGFLEEKACVMLSWLSNLTYKNGNIPLLNDSSIGIAPTSKELFSYAKSLHLNWRKIKLFDSGYRKFQSHIFEVAIDVGNIQPSYQPGHSHSDTFSFELYAQNIPIIVDPGVSTYEKNDRRQRERGTYYHNTVQIGNLEQTQVWGGFRVAKRAKVFGVIEDENKVLAKHDGYKNKGVIHSRQFHLDRNTFSIKDSLEGKSSLDKKMILHFHPDVNISEISKSEFQLNNLILNLTGEYDKVVIQDYEFSMGFNKTRKGKKIVVFFNEELETRITEMQL